MEKLSVSKAGRTEQCEYLPVEKSTNTLDEKHKKWQQLETECKTVINLNLKFREKTAGAFLFDLNLLLMNLLF